MQLANLARSIIAPMPGAAPLVMVSGMPAYCRDLNGVPNGNRDHEKHSSSRETTKQEYTRAKREDGTPN